MFSLIVSIIAVILTAGIAAATIYYGGSNVNSSGSRATAEQLVNAGEHLTSAGALYQNDHAGNLPNTPAALAPDYLSSIPLPPVALYAKGQMAPATTDWTYLAGTADIILPKLSLNACKAVNALYGIAGVPATLDSRYLIQCYGTAEPYTFYFDPPGGNMQQAAQIVTAPKVSSISPSTLAAHGGTVTTLTGSNFSQNMTVTMGGVPATNIQYVSATQIAVTAPAHAIGTVDVVVTNNDSGGSLTIPNAVTFANLTTVLSYGFESASLPSWLTAYQGGLNYFSGAPAYEGAHVWAQNVQCYTSSTSGLIFSIPAAATTASVSAEIQSDGLTAGTFIVLRETSPGSNTWTTIYSQGVPAFWTNVSVPLTPGYRYVIGGVSNNTGRCSSLQELYMDALNITYQ